MIFGRRHATKETRSTEPVGADRTAAVADLDTSTEPPHDASTPGDTRPAGLRLTEGLLPIFGPAQVGDSTAPVRPASEAERGRDRELRTTLTRMVGADGRSYVVAVPEDGPDQRRPAEGDRTPD